MRMTDSVTKRELVRRETYTKYTTAPDTRKQQSIREPQQTLKIQNM